MDPDVEAIASQGAGPVVSPTSPTDVDSWPKLVAYVVSMASLVGGGLLLKWRGKKSPSEQLEETSANITTEGLVSLRARVTELENVTKAQFADLVKANQDLIAAMNASAQASREVQTAREAADAAAAAASRLNAELDAMRITIAKRDAYIMMLKEFLRSNGLTPPEDSNQ